tara:strand:+ start:174 stop:518 length:345 start_codon:yes stop_codon:yes gene_type:complete
MKKLIIATAVAAMLPSLAFAATTGTNLTGSVTVTDATASEFVQDAFTLTLSAGTSLDYIQDNDAMAVKTTHDKGSPEEAGSTTKKSFGGTTSGGIVDECTVGNTLTVAGCSASS